MTQYIPYAKQQISDSDIEAVINVLKSDWLTQGPLVQQFETCLSERFRSRYCLALTNATSALHISCLALGVKSGDIVWTSPITFVASANCALYCGAKVDFVDIDLSTFNISPALLEEKLIKAKLEGKLPKILIVVHMCGLPCDMEAIYRLSREYGFKIIEDASHAVGSKYNDYHTGSCKYSDITVMSFHPVKIITTGEGGACLTNDLKVANQLQKLRSHGIVSDKQAFSHFKPNEIWNYQQVSLGYNYRITDIQAALGISQLQSLDLFLNARHQQASYYKEKLSHLPLHFQYCPKHSYSSYHLFVVRFCEILSPISQSDAFAYLKQCGIGVNLHYIPVYLQPFYQALGFKRKYCPNAEKYFTSCATLPLFPSLQPSQQDRVVESLINLFQS